MYIIAHYKTTDIVKEKICTIYKKLNILTKIIPITTDSFKQLPFQQTIPYHISKFLQQKLNKGITIKPTNKKVAVYIGRCTREIDHSLLHHCKRNKQMF